VLTAASGTLLEMPSETTYTIRVAGPLDDPALEEFAPTRDGDDATTLTVTVADQAQLHGVLARLRDSDAVLAELRATTPVAAPPAALERPLHTERLTLRSVTVADAEAVWRYRRLASVAEWLTGSAGDLDRFRASFADPDRLGTTIVIEEGHAADAPVIGDLMLRRGDAWAQTEVADRHAGWRRSSAGSSTRLSPATATPRRPSASSSATASRTSACTG
jgi:hypothetical protein